MLLLLVQNDRMMIQNLIEYGTTNDINAIVPTSSTDTRSLKHYTHPVNNSVTDLAPAL